MEGPSSRPTVADGIRKQTREEGLWCLKGDIWQSASTERAQSVDARGKHHSVPGNGQIGGCEREINASLYTETSRREETPLIKIPRAFQMVE